MWVEVSPDGRWAWTSSGRPTSSPTKPRKSPASRAGPAGAPLVASEAHRRVLRAPGVSGATFLGDRLYLAFDRGSYCPGPLLSSRSGRRVTWERRGGWRSNERRRRHSGRPRACRCDALGGTLHWQIQPEPRSRSARSFTSSRQLSAVPSAVIRATGCRRHCRGCAMYGPPGASRTAARPRSAARSPRARQRRRPRVRFRLSESA